MASDHDSVVEAGREQRRETRAQRRARNIASRFGATMILGD